MTNGAGVGGEGEPTDATRQTASRTVAQPEAVVVTAEIPTVAPSRRHRDSAFAAGPPDEPPRRLPASAWVRAGVWLLALLVLLGVVGIVIEHVHPTSLSFLRNVAVASSPRSSKPTAGRSSGLTLKSTGTKGATYTVDASSYTIVVETTQRCFADLKSPPNSSTYLFASVVSPTASPMSLKTLSSASKLALGAQATAIVIRSDNKTLGKISNPTPNYAYTFRPTKP